MYYDRVVPVEGILVEIAPERTQSRLDMLARARVSLRLTNINNSVTRAKLLAGVLIVIV